MLCINTLQPFLLCMGALIHSNLSSMLGCTISAPKHGDRNAWVMLCISAPMHALGQATFPPMLLVHPSIGGKDACVLVHPSMGGKDAEY